MIKTVVLCCLLFHFGTSQASLQNRKLPVETGQSSEEDGKNETATHSNDELNPVEGQEGEGGEREVEGEDVDGGDMGEELEAMLHEGEGNVHETSDEDEDSKPEDEASTYMDIQEELESILHGGEKHVHSGKHRSFIAENSTSQFGTADQESLLHGEDHDVHAIKEEVVSEEAHDGGEGMDLSIELEALLHGDDGHAHDKPQQEEMSDGRSFEANDPEHQLHGEVGLHAEGREEKEEEDEDDRRSRNLQFSPENVDGNVGSITKEDFVDYQEWRKNRNVGKKNWMSGFSYISDSIKLNLDAIKQRYLSSIFSNSSDQQLNIHDEA